MEWMLNVALFPTGVSALYLPSSLPSSMFPSTLPSLHNIPLFTYFYAAIKGSKAMLKPGVTSWFNSNRFCIYLFLHWLGLLTFLHPTWKKEIFHCMVLCFPFYFSKEKKKRGLWEQKNSSTIWVHEDLVQNSLSLFFLRQGTWISKQMKTLSSF